MSPGGAAADGAAPPVAALATLLAVSGAAALLHEGAWFRMLPPVVGFGAVPAAVVAAGALLGIAAGSAAGGVAARRTMRPARVFAGAEVAAAAVGASVPAVLPPLAGLPEAVALSLATVVLAVAAFPWGFALPAALRLLAPEGARAGSAFRALYAWNTAGALLGIAAGAVWLLEALGNRGTVFVAAALQAAVAAGALRMEGRCAAAGAARGPAAGGPAVRSAGRPLPRAGLFAAAALAGAAGLAAQVAWLRRLAPVLCATYPVYACVLGVHVGGIAAGAALLGPRRGGNPARAVALLAVAAAAATAATPFLTAGVVEAVRATWWEAGDHGGVRLAIRAAVVGALVLPGVLLGAAILPWLVRGATGGAADGDEDAGGAAGASGFLLAANAAGATAGGMVAALVLVPAAGTAGTLVIAAGLLLLAGAATASRAPRGALAVAAILLAALPLAVRVPDEGGRRAVGPLYTRAALAADETRTVFAADGRSASVLVRDEDGRLAFWVDGSLEASNAPTDRLHLGLLGDLPLVLFTARARRPARVALVGLGAGYTARAAERHGPAELVVYELEPEVARAAEHFRAAGGGVPASARLVFGDGRRGLRSRSDPLDVVSSDPVHPSRAGSAFLYSLESYREASEVLTPEGVIVQWLPLYGLHVDDVRLALRTFVAGVKHAYAFVAGPDALLVGSAMPLRLSPARLEEATRSPAAEGLREQGLAGAGILLAFLALDPDGCRTVAGEGAITTDDRLLLEFRSARRETDDVAAAYALLRSVPADPRSILDGPVDARFEADLAHGRRIVEALDAWVREDWILAARRFAGLASMPGAGALVRRLRDASDVERAWELVAAGETDRARRAARAVAERADAETLHRLDAAEVLLRIGDVGEARAVAVPIAEATGHPRARRLAR